MSKVHNLPKSLYSFSGKVEIAVNGTHLAVAKLNRNSIDIQIENEMLFRNIVQKLPVKIHTIIILSKLSLILYRAGLSMHLEDSKGTLLSLGSGTYSSLRKANVKLLRLRKYL
ncbi:MAG: hypothetical protein ACP5RY_04695 [Thermoplasmata archaeon]